MKILVRNLCKSYHHVTVLDHISFTASPGVTCIMGPSGRGKTTLLRILLGLETPDSGEICCSDFYYPPDVSEQPGFRQSGSFQFPELSKLSGLSAISGMVKAAPSQKICRWSAVFQEDRLLEHLDAWENLRFALPLTDSAERSVHPVRRLNSGTGSEYAETNRKFWKHDAEALLNELGLQNISGKPVRSWSGGMKRRLALARALLADCDALALDEPFTGLDEENRKRAIACIARAAEQLPVILVTHQKEDAEALHARQIAL